MGLGIALWSIKYIQIRNGATIFLVLTLVGGGLGYIVLILPTWAFATLINKPLNWWKNTLAEGLRKRLTLYWISGLTATLISWLIVMQLGIFGYFPGQDNPETIMNIVFIFLFSTVILACLTFVSAIAGDTEGRKCRKIFGEGFTSN